MLSKLVLSFGLLFGLAMSSAVVAYEVESDSSNLFLKERFRATFKIRGKFSDDTGDVGTLAGTYTLQKFSPGSVAGVYAGTLTTAEGRVVGATKRPLAMTVSASRVRSADAGCGTINISMKPAIMTIQGYKVTVNNQLLSVSSAMRPDGTLAPLICEAMALIENGSNPARLSAIFNQFIGMLK